MANTNRKIMGLPPINIMDIINSEVTEFDVNNAVDLANKIYKEVETECYENDGYRDSNEIRAIAILRIVLELQTIKGKQEVFLDTNSRRMNELIKLVDSMESTI
ncbi:MAG: hypothetical protein II669_06375 [Elusimicrobia bacterium]|jgi:hypothetical protein|nr:hypothetical protein [Elusimicrobiota bacterium]MBR4632516.1 hypothetical protein [Elusimicrobiota bacterium]